MIEISAMLLSRHNTYVYNGYTHTQTVLSGTTGEPYYVPPSLRQGKITIELATEAEGEGRVEYTMDGHSLILSGDAEWSALDGNLSSVTGTAADAIVVPVTGFRIVSIAGTIVSKVAI